MNGLMIQGTASDVGKSLICTALCTILHQRGYKVTPFKSQNMSNNSYVTKDGKEIGRAQGIQAEAANIEASVEMNPILLKPQSDEKAEVVLLGKRYQSLGGREYRDTFYEKGLEVIQSSLAKLSEQFEAVVIEGAGSPVEINLNDRELVNMKVAEIADVPVILVADIDRGGVFASIIGTLTLLSETERKRVKGIIINKFRGDQSLFESGRKWLEEKTGIPVLGVIPYVENHAISGEDSLSISARFQSQEVSEIDIAVMKLPYISNYTDAEPFLFEEGVSVRMVSTLSEFGNPDAVIIPGTKSTISDLHSLRASGLEQRIKTFVQSGGTIVGICGGYQMLSKQLIDEYGTDTGISGYNTAGFGLIPAVTTFSQWKKTIQTEGTTHPLSGFLSLPVRGYEIHLGQTMFQGPHTPLLMVENEAEGVSIEDGRILGTYVHNLFHNDLFRTAWLNKLRGRKGLPEQKMVSMEKEKMNQYENLAAHVEKHLDVQKLLEIMTAWREQHG